MNPDKNNDHFEYSTLYTMCLFLFPVERLLSASQQDLDKHVAALIESIGTPERGPVSQKRVQLLNYVATIGGNSQLANALVAAGMLNTLALQFKDASLLET